LPIEKQPARSFPWWSAVPVAVVVGGLVWYFNGRGTVTPATGSVREATEQQAKIGPVDDPKKKDSEPAVTIEPIVGESNAALNKRIDVALGKARRAYLQKDYDGAVMMASSALQLDPTRRDVAALRTAAVKEIQKKATSTEPVAIALTPDTESPKAVEPAPETKASEPAEDAKEKRLNEKQEQQSTYDQLIEEGVKAITNGNNKPKAIALFNKAQVLAKEHELSNDRADAAYASYMNKANKIFDNDEYDGAKDWYEVARALKNTDEVRRKIKQCINQ
jgi:tetratricopeptide (TPR) repeat protein